MTDLELTLRAISERGWTIVLLEPGAKKIRAGLRWEECQTRSAGTIRNWLRRGGGIGIDAHSSHIVVIDLDRPADSLCSAVGPLPPYTSTSPSGGHHVYMQLPVELDPARLPRSLVGPDGVHYGEIVRGPHEHAVMPPSPYPGSPKRGVPAGGTYRWLVDPRDGIYLMPRWWVEYLTEYVPADIREAQGLGLPPDEPWDGPSTEELIARALQQPGARHYRGGIKFQCPGCRIHRGRDRHRDNAHLRSDGRWGCAVDPAHRRDIAVALGVTEEPGPTIRNMMRDFLDE